MPDRVISGSVKAGQVIEGLHHTDKDKVIRRVPFGNVYQTPSGFIFTEYEEDNLPTVTTNKYQKPVGAHPMGGVSGNDLFPQVNFEIPRWFTNATINAAVAENPAVATASGWTQDENGNWVQRPTPETDRLANNLAEISLMSPTNPVTATIDGGIRLGLKTVPYFTRFTQGVKDRYYGMVYAKQIRNNGEPFLHNVFDMGKYNWDRQWRSKVPWSLQTGVGTDNVTGNAVFISDGTPIFEKDGNTFIISHLGGHGVEGGGMNNIQNMPLSSKLWSSRFASGTPKGTHFGERGISLPFSELYKNQTAPSWRRAFIDQVRGKKPLSSTYKSTNAQEIEDAISANSSPEDIAILKSWHANNEPLSMDSYREMLLMAKKGKFNLTYEPVPMGFFNGQGNQNKALWEELKNLPLEEQVTRVNEWIKSINPNARLAYVKNGKIQIPKLILVKK